MNREGKKCVLYPRVSTEMQVCLLYTSDGTEMQVDGYSLEGQKKRIKAIC